MCGVTAIFTKGGIDRSVLAKMTDRVAHRGPDGVGLETLTKGGVPTDDAKQATVGLGHRRLSIIDLSEGGRQPMRFGESLWVTYNGEIYNYVELKAELEGLGHTFRSQSDTEVILAAYAQWGDDCFRRFRGMWGIVLVDFERRVALLSRDRLGIKPLYWIRDAAGALYVVSEVKQLLDVPNLSLAPNERAVISYVTTGYELPGETFFESLQPVLPGSSVIVDLETLNVYAPRSYWFPEDVEPYLRNPRVAAERFRETLTESVRVHLRSDVPVGCALSGGLDSSAIATIVDAIGSADSKLHTFSVVFNGHSSDESRYIDAVVRNIRAEAHSITPTPQDVLRELDNFVYMHDEPVGSLSQYAAYAVARLTREAGVPVTLNGQGGDEVLSGYWQGYFTHLRSMARHREVFSLSAQMIGSLLPGGNSELVRQVPKMARRYWARLNPGRHLEVQPNFRGYVPKSRAASVVNMDSRARRVLEIRELYLPRLLKWDDRNFMAFSVEGRYPFIDHEVIELCLSMTPEVLYDRGWAKRPLRMGLKDLLPTEVTARRDKMGFETPQDRWLVGALWPTIERLLENRAARVWSYVPNSEGQRLAHSIKRNDATDLEATDALFRLFNLDRWLTQFFE